MRRTEACLVYDPWNMVQISWISDKTLQSFLPKGCFQLKVTVNMIRSYVFSTSKDVRFMMKFPLCSNISFTDAHKLHQSLNTQNHICSLLRIDPWPFVKSLHCITSVETFLKRLTPMIDQDRISPYNINKILGRQVMRIKKNINCPYKLNENHLADSKENY